MYQDKIINVPDFPIPGIQFKDITPILSDPIAFRAVVDDMISIVKERHVDKIIAPESRGYLFGCPVAVELGTGFVPVRKPGKLPRAVHSQDYQLEYATNTLQIHQDAIQPGEHVVIIDDLLATGGTTKAMIDLIEKAGGEVVGIVFLIELEFLNGREKLAGYPVESLIKY
jgi:adenine phosphoribosyltransferase